MVHTIRKEGDLQPCRAGQSRLITNSLVKRKETLILGLRKPIFLRRKIRIKGGKHSNLMGFRTSIKKEGMKINIRRSSCIGGTPQASLIPTMK